MQTTLLYWFAAQQQSSTFRWQGFSLLYLKFCAKVNALSIKFEKDRKLPNKAKTKIDLDDLCRF